jgi:hypothetical protein
MIVDNVWKLTNTVRVGLDARSSHARRQSSFPDNVCSCSIPRVEMVKRSDKTNTGEGGKGKKSRTVSDDSAHSCVQSVRHNIREDMEDRWVTNLSEDRKRFYLVSSLLDPRTKMLSFCDNKYFPSSWKDDALGYLSMDLKSFTYNLLREK